MLGVQFKCTKTFVAKPFIRDANDEINRAAEGDVVQREEELGEEVGIEFTLLGEGPGEHFKYENFHQEKVCWILPLTNE